ncbi:MAG: hypothetical protein J0L83_14480 [Chitinophagales bacterium]|nr:hypothetical protein [Chitinophagales bacterium]
MKTASTVLQTPFERAVAQVLEYLVKHIELHQKFRHKSELLNQLGLESAHYSHYVKGRRNIPQKHWHELQKVLLKHYHVHPTFLHLGTGPMFKDDAPWLLNEDPASYMAFTKENFDQLVLKLQSAEIAIAKLRAEKKALKQELEALKTGAKTRAKVKK